MTVASLLCISENVMTTSAPPSVLNDDGKRRKYLLGIQLSQTQAIAVTLKDNNLNSCVAHHHGLSKSTKP